MGCTVIGAEKNRDDDGEVVLDVTMSCPDKSTPETARPITRRFKVQKENGEITGLSGLNGGFTQHLTRHAVERASAHLVEKFNNQAKILAKGKDEEDQKAMKGDKVKVFNGVRETKLQDFLKERFLLNAGEAGNVSFRA